MSKINLSVNLSNIPLNNPGIQASGIPGTTRALLKRMVMATGGDDKVHQQGAEGGSQNPYGFTNVELSVMKDFGKMEITKAGERFAHK